MNIHWNAILSFFMACALGAGIVFTPIEHFKEEVISLSFQSVKIILALMFSWVWLWWLDKSKGGEFGNGVEKSQLYYTVRFFVIHAICFGGLFLH